MKKIIPEPIDFHIYNQLFLQFLKFVSTMKTNNLLQRFFGLVSQSCFFHNSIFSFYRNTLHHLPCHRSCAFASTGRRNALCFSQHHRLLRRCHLLLRINHHQSSISNLHGKMRTSHKFQV